jgi:hypothetical protein
MKIIYDQDRSIARFAASNGQSLARGSELNSIAAKAGEPIVLNHKLTLALGRIDMTS